MIDKLQKVIKFLFSRGIGAETIRYIIVGALTTFINFAVFTLMTRVLGIEVNISNVTSIAISILFAYIANKFVVFRRRSGSIAGLAAEFAKFVGSRLFTMALEVGVVHVFYYILGYDALIGKVSANVLVIIANYIISKAIVFRKSASSGSSDSDEKR